MATFEMRVTLLRMLESAPPRKPDCFDTEPDWHAWLLQSYLAGDRIVRRQDTGKWVNGGYRVVRTVFAIHPQQHCKHCDIGGAWQQKMVRQGRCERARAEAAAHNPGDKAAV